MKFYVNNRREIELQQAEPDGPVKVTTWGAPDEYGAAPFEGEYTINPGDFVMMLNWYQHQKRTGNKDLLF